MRKKILILGGGFAGLAAARYLARRQDSRLAITLVNRHNWNIFWPLLPDLISGRVLPTHISYALERFCGNRGIKFIRAEVEEIQPRENKVVTSAGVLEADYFILCLGCETNFFGNENIEAHAPGLKSLFEAVQVRQMVKEVVEKRKTSGSDSRGHIMVVGGGYTGFETASQIVHLLRSMTRRSFKEVRDLVRVEIVEKMPKVLSNTSPGVQRWAEHLIRSYGVEVRKGLTVESFEDGRTIRMSDGSQLQDAMVVWTAGVTPGHACSTLDVSTVEGGRLKVDRYLRVDGLANFFAAGDVAGPTPRGHRHPLRMSVQFSERGGRMAAANVLRDIRSKPLVAFDPADLGYVIPLAPGEAIGVVLGTEMHGRIPFLLHYIMSVARSFGMKNRSSVAKDLWSELLPEWIRKEGLFEQDVLRVDLEEERRIRRRLPAAA